MKKVILDTNALLRLILNDIADQALLVEKLLESARAGEVTTIVPSVVIFEIEFALRKFYTLPKEKVIDLLFTIVSDPSLDISERDIFILALKQYKKTTNLSFVDCFLYCSSKRLNAQLFTFDKKLLKK